MSDWIILWNDAAAIWWDSIARASLQGGAAIAAVWGITRLAPRLSPRVQCWLWRAAYVKLVLALVWHAPVELPVLPAAPVSPLVTAGWTPPDSALAGLAPSLAGERLPQPDPAMTPTASSPAPKSLTTAPRSGTVPVSFAGWALCIWLSGVLVCIRQIGTACAAARLLRGRSASVDVPAIRTERNRLARLLGLRRVPRLVSSAETPGPLLLGGWEASIVLPTSLLQAPPTEVRLVLAHELAHLRRGDLRWNWLPALGHAFFYFHPLVWLAGAEWRLAQEMACDELALRTTDAGAGDYGEMLLKIATAGDRHSAWKVTSVGSGTQAVGTVWSEDSPCTLRRRLNMLRNYFPLPSRSHRWSRSTGAALWLAASGICLVPWQVTAQDAPDFSPAAAAPRIDSIPDPIATNSGEEQPERSTVDPAPPSAQPESGVSAPPESEERVQPEPRAATLPGAEHAALTEQWEDVLLLEAMRYLGVTVAQTRGLHPLTEVTARRLKELAEQDRKVQASLARIARESRQALLNGLPGIHQREALELENTRRRKRARAEEELLDFAVPRLAGLLTREQVVRACLLTLGEPPTEPGRPASPALLNPEAGFVLAAPSEQPSAAQRSSLEERLNAVRGRWNERWQASAKKELAGRYPEEVLNSLFGPRALFLTDLDGTTSDLARTLTVLKDPAEYDVRVRFTLEPGAEETPQVTQARKDLAALVQRSQRPLAQILNTEATPEELRAGLRHFARRMCLSPRLRPVVEARLRLR